MKIPSDFCIHSAYYSGRQARDIETDECVTRSLESAQVRESQEKGLSSFECPISSQRLLCYATPRERNETKPDERWD